MASPRPNPPCWRVVDPSAWRKRSKIKGWNSLSMPMPVSITETRIPAPQRSPVILICPPFGVNFTALLKRFQKICCKRVASPSTGAPDSMQVSSTISFASRAGRTESIAASMMLERSTARYSISSLLVMMRETSSKSSINCDCERALRSIVSNA